jgi:hypothetical protein
MNLFLNIKIFLIKLFNFLMNYFKKLYFKLFKLNFICFNFYILFLAIKIYYNFMVQHFFY